MYQDIRIDFSYLQFTFNLVRAVRSQPEVGDERRPPTKGIKQAIKGEFYGISGLCPANLERLFEQQGASWRLAMNGDLRVNSTHLGAPKHFIVLAMNAEDISWNLAEGHFSNESRVSWDD